MGIKRWMKALKRIIKGEIESAPQEGHTYLVDFWSAQEEMNKLRSLATDHYTSVLGLPPAMIKAKGLTPPGTQPPPDPDKFSPYWHGKQPVVQMGSSMWPAPTISSQDQEVKDIIARGDAAKHPERVAEYMARKLREDRPTTEEEIHTGLRSSQMIAQAREMAMRGLLQGTTHERLKEAQAKAERLYRLYAEDAEEDKG